MKTIEITDEQYGALIAGESITIEPQVKKNKKWQPLGGDWKINDMGKAVSDSSNFPTAVKRGVRFATEHLAKDAEPYIRNFNRLLHFVQENGGIQKFVPDFPNYYVSYDVYHEKYVVASEVDNHLPLLYMTADCARRLADMANEGAIDFLHS